MIVLKKIKYLTFLFFLFQITTIVAQCDQANPYHNYGGWSTDTSNNASISIEMTPGSDITVGMDPKNKGESISYSVCGVTGKTFSPAADYKIVNPVPNAGDTCAVVATYTNVCGTFIYTWNLIGKRIPDTGGKTCGDVVPYYNIGKTWVHPSNTIGQESEVTIELALNQKVVIGIDPKAGATITHTGCGIDTGKINVSDFTVTPITAADQTCSIVSVYKDACGTFTYTWNFKAMSTVPICTPDAIVPYHQITSTSATWFQDSGTSASLDVLEGDVVTFGPQVKSAGTWSWTGCGITNGNQREQKVTMSAVDCVVVGTFTNDCGKISSYTYNLKTGIPPCSLAILYPFYQIKGKSQRNVQGASANITLEAGTEISFGAKANQIGTWSWTGCTTSGTTNISNSIILTQNCAVTVTFTNNCDTSLVSSYTFNITIGTSKTLVIDIPAPDFQIDTTKNLVLSRIDAIETYSNLSMYSEVIISFAGNDYDFVNQPSSLTYSDKYSITKDGIVYTLYFSKLPIISINTSQQSIPDEPKILASFTYSDEKQRLTTPFLGIEKRGGVSQGYPKNTYDLEFWADATGATSVDAQFGNLRNDNDWVLDAMYNEPLRMRAYTTHKLWLEIYKPYFLVDEPKAKSGADVMFVEMFLNGKYNGVFMLSEQVDEKQLKIKKFKDGLIAGELYKGVNWGNCATTFDNLPSFSNDSRSWSGHDMKYPKANEVTDWTNLYHFTDFVMNSSDADFKATIWTQFHYGNYIDYFIFLNVLRATDNIGKNIYTAKYNVGEPYFYAPWDLDGVFGTNWTGGNDTTTNDIIGNEFHKRVTKLNVGTYTKDIRARWAELRGNVLNPENLKSKMQETYHLLKDNKVYEREALVYNNYPYDESVLNYMLDWTTDRIAYLDKYFNYTGPVLGVKENRKIVIYPYPNPAKGTVYIYNSNRLNNNEYLLYDVVGKVIKKGKLSEASIDVSEVVAGLYFLQLESGTYQLVLK